MAYLSRNKTSGTSGSTLGPQNLLTPILDFASFMMFFNEMFMEDKYYTNFGMTNDLQTSNIIGEGAQFEVKKLTLQRNMAVRTSGDATSRLTMGETIIIKRPRLAIDRMTGEFAEPDTIENIVQELRIISHPPLRKHSKILDVFGFAWELEDNMPTIKAWPIVMVEYAARGTLEDCLSMSTSLELNQKLHLAGDIAEGLDALHKCRIVHSDLKPANILVSVTSSGRLTAKLSDFGLSIIIDERKSSTLWVRGTEMWMAPEWGTPLSNDDLPSTDLYSCGLVLWSILVDGDEPWNNASFGVPNARELSFLQMKNRDDEILDVAIATLLAGDCIPKERFCDIALLIGSLLRRDPSKRNLAPLLTIGIDRQSDSTHAGEYIALESMAPADADGIDDSPLIFRDFSEISSQDIPLVVQCQLLDSLQSIANNETQPDWRKADASYAVSILHLLRIGTIRPRTPPLSGYTGYEIDYNQVTLWMRKAASLGSSVAQSSYYRIIDACGRLGPEDPISHYTKVEWLKNGVMFGSHIASYCLREVSKADWEKAHSVLRTERCGVGRRLFGQNTLRYTCDEENLQRLQNMSHDRRRLNSRGDTVLHWASMTGFETAVIMICQDATKSDLDFTNDVNETALFQATRSGHITIVEHLLSYGADPAICTTNGENVLHWLSSFEIKEERLRHLSNKFIRRGARLEQICSKKSIFSTNSSASGSLGSPLRRAVERNHYCTAKILTEQGADPYLGGRTSPIALACSAHNSTLLELFLPPNYPIQHPGWYGKDLFELDNVMEVMNASLAGARTFQTAAPNTWQTLVGQGEEDSLLGYALNPLLLHERIILHGSQMKANMERTIRKLRDVANEDFRRVTCDFKSAMMQAVSSRDIEIVSFLLEFDHEEMVSQLLHPHPTGHGCQLPIQLAIIMRDRPIFEKLLEVTGPNTVVDTPSVSGITNQIPWQDMLNVAGISDQMLDTFTTRWTIASLAASSDISNIIHLCTAGTSDSAFAKLILQSAADPQNLVNQHGHFDELPFTFAVARHSFGLAETLVEYGANEHEEANKTLGGPALSPLGVLIGLNNYASTKAIEWLLQREPNFIVNQELGLTAIDMAVRGGGVYEMEGGKPSQLLPIELYKFYAKNLELLLSHFNTPEQVNHQSKLGGFTALHWAIFRLNANAIKLLLEAKADINIISDFGFTPKQIAESLSEDDVPDVVKLRGKKMVTRYMKRVTEVKELILKSSSM